MRPLSLVFLFKIIATVTVWCGPLLLLPTEALLDLGLPIGESDVFARLLGWAYLSLCVGYVFGLAAALKGKRAMGPIWVGVISNSGACVLLVLSVPDWINWSYAFAATGIFSILATAAITAGLIIYGVRAEGDKV